MGQLIEIIANHHHPRDDFFHESHGVLNHIGHQRIRPHVIRGY